MNITFSEMVEATKQKIRVLLSNKQVDQHAVDAVFEEFTAQGQNKILILSG